MNEETKMIMEIVDEPKTRKSQPKFTPGPWHVLEGERCCHVASSDRLFQTGCIMFAGVEGDGIANARLIAAAPDLYEALRALLPYLTDRAQLLDYASLNEGRASGFDVASVKAREALALVDSQQTKGE